MVVNLKTTTKIKGEDIEHIKITRPDPSVPITKEILTNFKSIKSLSLFEVIIKDKDALADLTQQLVILML